MGEAEYWLWATVAFGLISAMLYTWLSSGKSNRVWLFIRSAIVYTALAFIMVWVIFRIADI